MMRQNDTLVIKKGVSTQVYFDVLMQHKRNNPQCRVVRLEALGSAIPNLVKVAQTAELCDLGAIVKIAIKPRRMKIGEHGDGLSITTHEAVQCKFLECMKVDMELLWEEPVKSAPPKKVYNQPHHA